MSWFYIRLIDYQLILKNLNILFIILSLVILFLIILCKSIGKIYELLFILSIIFNMFFFRVGKIILFYVFFELRIIPILVIIIKWGLNPERLKAGMYIIIYTLIGSIPLILGIVFYIESIINFNIFFFLGALTIPDASYIMVDWLDFCREIFSFNWWYVMCLVQWTVFLLIVSFFIKLPLFGVHLWLPKAHVEAPTEGSMILASILLKLGIYGLIRIRYLIDNIKDFWSVLICCWGIWGILLIRLITFRQIDLKIIIAYSSVFHMLILVFVYSTTGCLRLISLIFLSIGHGFCSSVLFWKVGKFYSKSSTRNLKIKIGYIWQYPIFIFIWLICLVLNCNFPPIIKFFSELLVFFSSKSILYEISFVILWRIFIGGLFKMYLFMVNRHGKYSIKLKIFNNIRLKKIFIRFIHILMNCISIFWIIII